MEDVSTLVLFVDKLPIQDILATDHIFKKRLFDS